MEPIVSVCRPDSSGAGSEPFSPLFGVVVQNDRGRSAVASTAWSSIGSEYGASTLQRSTPAMARPEDLAYKDLNGRIAVVTRESTPFSYTKSAELIAAVTDAGAKAVILVNDRPGPFATQVSRVTGTAIPAWSLTQDEGAVLFGRMADSPTGIKLQGITGVPQVYNIAMMVPGGIPADPTDAVTAENSTVMKSHYRSTKGTRIGDVDSAIRPIEGVVFDIVNFFDAPLDQEEWYSTGSRSPMMKDIRWWHRINPDRSDISRTVRDGLRTYQPGEQREQTWLGAANGPAGPEASQAVREGDNVTLTIPEMGDSRGHAGLLRKRRRQADGADIPGREAHQGGAATPADHAAGQPRPGDLPRHPGHPARGMVPAVHEDQHRVDVQVFPAA